MNTNNLIPGQHYLIKWKHPRGRRVVLEAKFITPFDNQYVDAFKNYQINWDYRVNCENRKYRRLNKKDVIDVDNEDIDDNSKWVGKPFPEEIVGKLIKENSKYIEHSFDDPLFPYNNFNTIGRDFGLFLLVKVLKHTMNGVETQMPNCNIIGYYIYKNTLETINNETKMWVIFDDNDKEDSIKIIPFDNDYRAKAHQFMTNHNNCILQINNLKKQYIDEFKETTNFIYK
jgi:hypothetical protein